MVSRLSNPYENELNVQNIHHPKVERVLRWFEKEGNELVGEKFLNELKIEHLQNLFGISSDNPMYDCYPLVTAEQVEYFQNFIDFKIDIHLYDYFLECDAV